MNKAQAVIREYAVGELLCRQGTGAGRVFVLKSGGVRATVVSDKVLPRADDKALAGGYEIAQHTEAGAMLGTEGALMGSWLNSLIAESPTTVVEIPVEMRGMIHAVGEKPDFGMGIARVLARRLLAANRAMSGTQRQAGRFQRDLQGMCLDFHSQVQHIGENARGEDEVLQALSVAKRTWAYAMGEVGGADVSRNTRVMMADTPRRTGGQQIRLAPGEFLCRKGDQGGSVFLLISGRLSVRVGDERFGEIRPGETAGEIGVLLGDAEPRRTADIVADEPSEIAIISNNLFPGLLSEHPRLLVNLCKTLAIRVRSFEQLVADQDDALQEVAVRYGGEDSSFVSDVTALQKQLAAIAEDGGLDLRVASDELGRLADRWREKMGDLNEKLAARSG